jgi:hypothetical protein
MTKTKEAQTLPDLHVEQWSVDKLRPYPSNPRKNDAVIDRMVASIREFGFRVPILAKSDGEIVDGHLRLKAAVKLGLKTVPVIPVDGLTDAQIRAFRLIVNRSVAWAEWDEGLLARELEALQKVNFDLTLTGFDDLDIDRLLREAQELTEAVTDAQVVERAGGVLNKQFLVPPFSVLDTRQGYWQERKQAWIGLGLQGEVGRSGVRAITDPAITVMGFYDIKAELEKDLERQLANKEALRIGIDRGIIKQMGVNIGTSIFDPVLCEIMYSWFCPKDGKVLDPFAGGPVRGVVAAVLGRQYVGVDLRKEQIDANYEQWQTLKPKLERVFGKGLPPPTWIVGNSLEIASLCPGEYDFMLSSPPYHNLEVYSDDPRDLSTMRYDAFIEALSKIIKASCDMLKEDRFAVFVVAEIRDNKKNKALRGFVADVIDAFKRAGCEFYNDMVLVNTAGSLPFRIRNCFEATRKIGKMHQNILVFVKGDAKRATQACGPVGVADLGLDEGENYDNSDRL